MFIIFSKWNRINIYFDSEGDCQGEKAEDGKLVRRGMGKTAESQ